MAKVNIGGRSYTVPDGANINVSNNQVTVNGQVLPSDDVRIEQVIITGDTGPVRADGSVTVNGVAKGDVRAGGSVKCENVTGNVDAGGSVHAADIGGSVKAGGSVRASKIGK